MYFNYLYLPGHNLYYNRYSSCSTYFKSYVVIFNVKIIQITSDVGRVEIIRQNMFNDNNPKTMSNK